MQQVRKHHALHAEMAKERQCIHVRGKRLIEVAVPRIAMLPQYLVQSLANAVIFRFQPKPAAHKIRIRPAVHVIEILVDGVKGGEQIPRPSDLFGGLVPDRRVEFTKPAKCFPLRVHGV